MPSFTILLRVSSCLSGKKNIKLFIFLSIVNFGAVALQMYAEVAFYLLSSAQICVKLRKHRQTSPIFYLFPNCSQSIFLEKYIITAKVKNKPKLPINKA